MGNTSFWLVVLGLLFVGAELLIGVATGFDLVLVGFALIAGGAVGMISGVWQLAFLISGVLTVIYFVVGRRTIKKWIAVETQRTNVDDLAEKTGVVIKAISKSASGQVKVGTEIWRAEAANQLDSFSKGEKIRVQAVSGVTLKVAKQ